MNQNEDDGIRREAAELIGDGPAPGRYLDATKRCERQIGLLAGDVNRERWEKLLAEVERRYRAYLGKPPRDSRYPDPDTE